VSLMTKVLNSYG